MSRTASLLVFTVLAACAADVDGGDPTDPNPNSPNPNDPNDPNDPDPSGTLTPAELLTAIGHKECDDAFACEATFPADAGITFAEAFGADVTACYADAAQYYDAAAVEAAIAAGTIAFDGAAAQACVAGFAAPVCSSYWTEGPAVPDACASALVGKVATGGACAIDLECAGDNWCDDTTRKCAAIPEGA